MKIVVVGAGNVGIASAEAAVKNNDVLIIEKDPAKAEIVKNTLPVSVLKEDGSNPKTLQNAIERINADIVLSAVPDDGVNLFICMMAKQIKPTVRTVACIRNPDYLSGSAEKSGVDLLVSPETIAADKIIHMALMENAVSYDDLDLMGLCLVTYRVEKSHDVVGKTVMNLDLPRGCSIVAIYRGDEAILTVTTAEIHAGDRICVLATHEGAVDFNKLVGVKHDAREIDILGAGPIGIAVARALMASPKRTFIKIIESDLEKCQNASRQLNDVIVVHGDFVDPLILHSENVDRADVLITVSGRDELNLLASLAALRFGIPKIITRYMAKEYDKIFKYTGLESIVGYHKVIVNEVTKHLVSNETSLIMMEHPGDYFFWVDIDKSAPVVDNYLGDLNFPAGIRIPAVIRDGVIHFPTLSTKFAAGDRLLIYAHDCDQMQLAKVLGHQAPEL